MTGCPRRYRADTANASNWVDRTNYCEVVQAEYLETMLWTHRERMNERTPPPPPAPRTVVIDMPAAEQGATG